MQELLDHAARMGIGEVFGEVLAENERMLSMCRRLGFVVSRGDDASVVHVSLKLE